MFANNCMATSPANSKNKGENHDNFYYDIQLNNQDIRQSNQMWDSVISTNIIDIIKLKRIKTNGYPSQQPTHIVIHGS